MILLVRSERTFIPFSSSPEGGKESSVRYSFQEYFEFNPQFKIFLAANHRPEIWGTDHAMWRRIRLIPFEVTIPPAERDKDLPAKLRAELSGILSWAVEGCAAWQQEGLGAPEEVEVATEDYREDMDPVGCFLEDCCLIDREAETTTRGLYNAFEEWCKRSGVSVMNVRRFGMRLSERGFLKVRLKNSRGWAGLKLDRDSDPLGWYQEDRQNFDSFK
jgi:putative DNA primase/helicase